MEHAHVIGAVIFKHSGWAQSIHYPVRSSDQQVGQTIWRVSIADRLQATVKKTMISLSSTCVILIWTYQKQRACYLKSHIWHRWWKTDNHLCLSHCLPRKEKETFNKFVRYYDKNFTLMGLPGPGTRSFPLQHLDFRPCISVYITVLTLYCTLPAPKWKTDFNDDSRLCITLCLDL